MFPAESTDVKLDGLGRLHQTKRGYRTGTSPVFDVMGAGSDAWGTINSTTGNVTDIGLSQTGNWQKYNGSVNTFTLANEMKTRDTNGSASGGVVDLWPSGSPGYSKAGGG